MFAQLGSVMFEVVGALTEFGGRREYSYAEHARIDGKPTVQFTGEGLEEADLGFALDEWLCEPTDALDELQTMAAAHQAVTLVWGDGRLQGPFVLRGIEYTVAGAAADGRPTRITGRVRLQEWATPPKATESAGTASGPPGVAGGAATGTRTTSGGPAPTVAYTTVSDAQITRRPR